MPSFVAWPPDAYQPYYRIRECLKHITDITKICIEDVRRYKDVLVAGAPLIEEWAIEISDHANEIIDLAPEGRGRGRPPKWLEVTEQVEELASDIANLVDEFIRPALKINDMIVIETALKKIERQGKEIQQALKTIPRPSRPANLEPWKEIVNEALSDFN